MARIRDLIVGIGASAGGVAALQAFFKPMPAEPGMAFVVVMHLGEGHQSAMPEILARATALPIVTVRDSDPVEPNRVYVLSADALLTVHNGRLRLRQQTAGSRVRNTIDVLFASLANDVGDRSIGVILSGSGHDGTLGAKAIKEKGGLTVAQQSDHGTPQYPEMPMNAIASGTVDLQIPVEEMAQRLCEYASGLDTLETRMRRDARNARSRVNRARQEICQILRDQIGHDFSGYKHRTFLRRVERRMQVLSLREIDDYIARLNEDRQEVIQLFRDLLIGVTAFFRDQEAFQSLAEEVIPTLFRGRGASDTVRIGPEVDPAAIKGYGSELIEAGLQAEIGATAKLNFTPAGIAAELVLPLSDGLAQPPVDVKPAEPPKFVANK